MLDMYSEHLLFICENHFQFVIFLYVLRVCVIKDCHVRLWIFSFVFILNVYKKKKI